MYRVLGSSFDSDTLDVDSITELHQAVINEVESIKESFIYSMFTCVRERCMEKYVHFHQQALIKVINDLFVIMTRQDVQMKLEELVQFILLQLEGILQFIEKHFSKYFNLDQAAPESHKKLVLTEIGERQIKIDTRFGQAGICGKLFDIYTLPIKKLLKNPDESVSYRYLIFIKEMQTELEQIDLTSDSESVLRSLLLYLNYNTPQVFNYYSSFITRNHPDSLSEQIEKLAFHMKEISQAVVKPGFACDHRFDSLKNQLLFWLHEEIEYLDKKNVLTLCPPSNAPSGEFKIVLDLSVAQLACLIKAFTETKVIQNQNISELIRFFSSNVKTKRAENISYESLRIKFYNVESGTKDAVKKILLTTSHYL